MNIIINNIHDLAEFLKCEVSEIPKKIKDVRECGIGLTLFYNYGGVLVSTDEVMTYPGKGSGGKTNPDINWNNPGTPHSFKLWSEEEWGYEETDQLKFNYIASDDLESSLNQMDDKMYKLEAAFKKG
jgi:hypothetical protein